MIIDIQIVQFFILNQIKYHFIKLASSIFYQIVDLRRGIQTANLSRSCPRSSHLHNSLITQLIIPIHHKLHQYEPINKYRKHIRQ